MNYLYLLIENAYILVYNFLSYIIIVNSVYNYRLADTNSFNSANIFSRFYFAHSFPSHVNTGYILRVNDLNLAAANIFIYNFDINVANIVLVNYVSFPLIRASIPP